MALPFVYAPTSLAETCPHGGSLNWQGVCDTTTDSGQEYFGDPILNPITEDVGSVPGVVAEPINLQPIQNPNDSLPPPSEEIIQENPWLNSSIDPEPNNSEIDPISQDEPETWAVIDENGKTLNIISCDIDFCGSGWIPTQYDGFTPIEWARVVLQSRRDPESGNNNGGHWGQYNFQSGIWTETTPEGVVYQIPVEHGQDPFCISNCPVDTPEEVVDQPEEESSEDQLSNEEIVESQFRNFSTKTTMVGNRFQFKHAAHKKKMVKFGKIWLIAKNKNEKKVWKFNIRKNGRINVILPIEYIDWDISVNYILKNNKKISKKITIKD